MRERDSLSRLLGHHGTGSGDHGTTAGRRQIPRGSARLFDDDAKVRLLDASLEVFAALRALADVTEEILRERRDSLLGGGDSEHATSAGSHAGEVPSADAPAAKTRQKIPLTY